MRERTVLVPENGRDVILLLKGIKDFVSETNVSYENAEKIEELCRDIENETTGHYNYD